MDTHIWFSIQLSLKVATVATLFVAVIGGVIAYFLATRQFRGKTFIEIVATPDVAALMNIEHYRSFLMP